MGMEDMDMTDETVVSGDSELPKSRRGAGKQTPDDRRRSQARCLGCLLASDVRSAWKKSSRAMVCVRRVN